LAELYKEESDPQLKEFLNVMAPRTKKTTWQNDDAVVPAATAVAAKPKVSLVKSKKPGGDNVYLTRSHVTFQDDDDGDDDGAEAAAAQRERPALVDDDGSSDDDEYQMLPAAAGAAGRGARAAADTDDDAAVEDTADEGDEEGGEDDGEVGVAGSSSESSGGSGAEGPRPPAAGGGKAKKGKAYPSAPPMEEVAENGRLFVRNLAFTCSEDELRLLFEKYGPLSEVHIPIDKATKASKGYAYVLFLMPEHAIKAMKALDGQIFQVRGARTFRTAAGRTRLNDVRSKAIGRRHRRGRAACFTSCRPAPSRPKRRARVRRRPAPATKSSRRSSARPRPARTSTGTRSS